MVRLTVSKYFLACFVAFSVFACLEAGDCRLQVIVFEAEVSDAYWQGGKTLQTEGSSIFPSRFSRLFLPMPPPPDTQLGLAVPREISTLDIDEFKFDQELLTNPKAKKKSFKKKNSIVDLFYQLELSSGLPALKVKVKGTLRNSWFSQEGFSLKEDSTTLAAIRLRDDHGVFMALTLFKAPSKTAKKSRPPGKHVSPPSIEKRVIPEFPAGLYGHSGLVMVQVVINQEGRVDPESVRIVRSPHPLFTKVFLRSLIEDWTFHPGMRDGSAVATLANVEVNFESR